MIYMEQALHDSLDASQKMYLNQLKTSEDFIDSMPVTKIWLLLYKQKPAGYHRLDKQKVLFYLMFETTNTEFALELAIQKRVHFVLNKIYSV